MSAAGSRTEDREKVYTYLVQREVTTELGPEWRDLFSSGDPDEADDFRDTEHALSPNSRLRVIERAVTTVEVVIWDQGEKLDNPTPNEAQTNRARLQMGRRRRTPDPEQELADVQELREHLRDRVQPPTGAVELMATAATGSALDIDRGVSRYGQLVPSADGNLYYGPVGEEPAEFAGTVQHVQFNVEEPGDPIDVREELAETGGRIYRVPRSGLYYVRTPLPDVPTVESFEHRVWVDDTTKNLLMENRLTLTGRTHHQRAIGVIGRELSPGHCTLNLREAHKVLRRTELANHVSRNAYPNVVEVVAVEDGDGPEGRTLRMIKQVARELLANLAFRPPVEAETGWSSSSPRGGDHAHLCNVCHHPARYHTFGQPDSVNCVACPGDVCMTNGQRES